MDSQQRTVIVRVAHSARLLQFPLFGNHDVVKLKEQLAGLADVATRDQVLLAPNGARIEDRKLIRDLEPHSASQPIFLYSRQHLRDANQRFQELSAGPPDLNLPLPSFPIVPEGKAPLTSSSEFARYPRLFGQQAQIAGMFCNDAAKKVHFLETLQDEVMARDAAIRTTFRNLESHVVVIQRRTDDFKQFKEECKKQSAERQTQLESGLRIMGDVQLHPAVRPRGKHTLLECVDEGKLRHYVSSFQQTWTDINTKYGHTESQFMELLRSIADENQSFGLEDFVSAKVHEAGTILNHMKDYMDAFAKGEKQTVDMCRRMSQDECDPSRANIDYMGSASACDAIAQSHAQLCTEMVSLQQRLKDIVVAVWQKREDSIRLYFNKLAFISRAQSQISQFDNKLVTYRECLLRQNQPVDVLGKMAHIPEAYQVLVAELYRRHRYRHLLKAAAERQRVRLQEVGQKEQRLREEFVKKYANYLPKDFPYASLTEKLPTLEFEIKDGDGALPDIEESSIRPDLRDAAAFLDDAMGMVATEDEMQSKRSSEIESLKRRNEELQAELKRYIDRCRAELNLVRPGASPSASMAPSTISDSYRPPPDILQESRETRSLLPGIESRQRQEVAALEQKFTAELEALKRTHREQMQQQQREMEQMRLDLLHKHSTELKEREKRYEIELQKAEKLGQDKIQAMRNQTAEQDAKTKENLILQVKKLERDVAECTDNSSNLEMQLHRVEEQRTKVAAENDRLNAELANKRNKESQLQEIITRLQQEQKHLDLGPEVAMWKEIARQRIAYQSFAIGDVALFERQADRKYYAFHRGQNIHYFMSYESVMHIEDQHRKGNFVLGEIISINKRRAGRSAKALGNGEEDPENPFDLPVGTEFKILTVGLLNLR